ncbi:MAG: hypothetical protein A3G26_00115 [Betaproteobacteria bacterium RIFCSPLOWO2_12_FULL_65_110]|nr:MAG: hypothetical protein A3G26_00115 [Betaproteobacteria bacterium RIFCSPLOWO2_12_FULL_65_110]
MPYSDLRSFLTVLEGKGWLKRITKKVNKDWEIAAVARVVFQDIPEKDRPALLFENVEGFDIPVVVGVLGGSRSIYCQVMETTPLLLMQKWKAAISKPIPPVVVELGLCQENILLGEKADLLKFPVPIWTAGQDPGPYITSPYVITKDPHTNARNVGTYRAQIKGARKLAMWVNFLQGGRLNIEAWWALRQDAPVAIVIGCDPTVGVASVSKPPQGLDELAVAGGLRGEALPVVRCRTVDLEVPASAEIVIEGLIRVDHLEQEGPFGEYSGYMGPVAMSYVVDVTCITHRNKPVFQAFLSQMPPSESSLIRGLGWEGALWKHLVEDLRMPIKDIHLLESTGSAGILVISMEKKHDTQPREAILASWACQPYLGKYSVVVDEDIDIRDLNQVAWALAWRSQPGKDLFVMDNMQAIQLDPSQAPAEVSQMDPARRHSAKVGIDATKKHNFPPVALPPQQHLEFVRAHWHEYGF